MNQTNWSEIIPTGKLSASVQKGFRAGYEEGLRYYMLDVMMMLVVLSAHIMLRYAGYKTGDKRVQLYGDMALIMLFVLIVKALFKMSVLKPA